MVIIQENNMTNTYTKIFNCLEDLTRANDPSKKLPLNTRKVAGYFLAKIQKSTSKVICVDFEVIMKVVETGERQARRILNQIRGTLFHIEYKKAARINNRFVQHKMVISLVDNNILNGLNVRPLYKENNIIINNNRSRANFCKNDLSEKILKLSDFTDLSEQDCETLRKISGRAFSSNAIKEIIKDVARKLTHIYFKYKAGFIAYMSKLLRNEMRDENKVNNETFKITANLTEEDKKEIMIEKYLTEVENTREVSQEMHLKKKLACILKRETAYELLRNYKDISIKNDIAEITLRNNVELTELEKNIVLSQVKATHETLINGVFEPIKAIKFIMLSYSAFIKNDSLLSPRTGVWGKLRIEIANLLGSEGESLDKHWFSKLEAEIDEQNKQIKLKAQSSFYKRFIEEKYSQVIQMAATSSGYKIYDIYC